jgi:uncharacterized iron-regulated membrane protein
MTFRKVLFWVHLVAGLISGLSIGVMCFTGTALAFEKDLIAWSERDARQVTPPSDGTPRLTLEQMQARLTAAQPEARPQSIVIQNDPTAAIAFTAGRSGGFYVNPYTGDVRQPTGTAMSDFMRTMTSYHRFLGLTGETSRGQGKLINGICNIAFCVLALTGLYLWMPRQWSWRALKPVIWFRQNGTSKARDFNWHNVIGFWSAPVLIVLTLTAIPISFQWGGRVITALTGGAPATPGGAGGGGGGGGPGGFGGGPAIEVTPPSPDAKPLSQDALLASVQKWVPNWKTITLRAAGAGGGGPGGGGRGGRGEGRGARGGAEGAQAARGGEGRGARGEGRGEGRGRGGESRGDQAAQASASTPPTQGEIVNRAAPIVNSQAVTVTVRESTAWPRTANTTLSLNPFTGEILRRTGYADLAAAQQVRSWTRFLHTGEALGWWGQLVAGLACLGGLFLVYTGFALSWRRFFGKKTPTPAKPAAVPATSSVAV